MCMCKRASACLGSMCVSACLLACGAWVRRDPCVDMLQPCVVVVRRPVHAFACVRCGCRNRRVHARVSTPHMRHPRIAHREVHARCGRAWAGHRMCVCVCVGACARIHKAVCASDLGDGRAACRVVRTSRARGFACVAWRVVHHNLLAARCTGNTTRARRDSLACSRVRGMQSGTCARSVALVCRSGRACRAPNLSWATSTRAGRCVVAQRGCGHARCSRYASTRDEWVFRSPAHWVCCGRGGGLPVGVRSCVVSVDSWQRHTR